MLVLENDKNPQIEFKEKYIIRGGTLAIKLPEQLQKHIQIEKDDEVIIVAKEGKYGKYLAIWKKEE